MQKKKQQHPEYTNLHQIKCIFTKTGHFRLCTAEKTEFIISIGESLKKKKSVTSVSSSPF